MEDDSQGISRTACNAAHPMLYVHAVKTTDSAHRTPASREDDCVSPLRVNDLRHRLRPRTLFYQQKLSTLVFFIALAQEADHLQREDDVAIDILMEAIVISVFIVKQQWRGTRLATAMALL